MSDNLIRALVIAFGVVMMAFGVGFFGWLVYRFRGEDRAVGRWAMANAAFYVAVGAVAIVSALVPGAVRYAALAVGVTLMARVVARRRLLKGGGLR